LHFSQTPDIQGFWGSGRLSFSGFFVDLGGLIMFFVQVLAFSFQRLYYKDNTAPAVILPLMPLGVDHFHYL